jgi:hypothetical protein
MKKRHARYWWAASQLSIVTAGEKGIDKERSDELLAKAKQSIEEGKKIDARLKWNNLERRIERIQANIT